MQSASNNGAAAENLTPWVWRSRMLADTCGVTVRANPEATTFSIDANGVLVVPALEPGSATTQKLLMGGTLQQIAMQRWSDLLVLASCSPIERTFLTIVEGRRVEMLACREWAGAQVQLTEMWEALYATGRVTRFDPTVDDPLVVLAVWMLGAARAGSQGLAPAVSDERAAQARFSELLSQDAAGFVQQHLQHLTGLESTRAALEWVRRLLEPFVRPDQKEEQIEVQSGVEMTGPDGRPEPPEPGQGECCESGASGASSEGSAAGEAGGNQGGPSSAAPAIDVIDFEFAETDGAELAKVAVGEAYAEEFGGAVDVLSPLVDANAQGGDGEGGARHDPSTSTDLQPRSLGEGLLASVSAASMGLRARLQHLLRTLTATRRNHSARGKLNPSRAWRVKVMDVNVFRPVSVRVALDTYLHVLADFSGSMAGGKDQLAMQAATSVAYACDGWTGISVGIDRFPSSDGGYVERLKHPGQSIRAAANALAGAVACGGTPLLQALPVAVRCIREQNAARSVLLIPTDGLPPREDVARCKAAISVIREAGIDVIVIGIGCDARAIDDQAIAIRSVGELPGMLFRALEAHLRGPLKRAA